MGLGPSWQRAGIVSVAGIIRGTFRSALRSARRTFGVHSQIDVQPLDALGQMHGAESFFPQGGDALAVFRAQGLEDFELALRGVGENSGDGCRLDALHAAGVGHGDALDVFDDVGAAEDLGACGHAAEDLAGLGRREGDGDRLGAAHGRHELFFEDSAIGVDDVIVQHGSSVNWSLG